MELFLNCQEQGYMIVKLNPKDREEAIHVMANELLKEGYVKDSYESAIIEREKNFPTGLLTEIIGIAIPHTDSKHVEKEGIILSILEDPVEFNAMGGTSDDIVKVGMIFMLAIKEKEVQLEMLQKLVAMFQDEIKLKILQELDDIEGIKSVMGELRK